MDWTYVTGAALYVAIVCLFIWTAAKDEDSRRDVHYYRWDHERGGYVGLNGYWVARKVLWREWGWYGVVILAVASVPLLAPGALVWELWLKRLIARKILISGGDGSSREAAIVIAAKYTQVGLEAEYRHIADKHGMYKVAWKRRTQMKVRSEGREYDLITIVLTADATERNYWFDITSFSGKWM